VDLLKDESVHHAEQALGCHSWISLSELSFCHSISNYVRENGLNLSKLGGKGLSAYRVQLC
jgi:hypothetical protein